MTPDQLIESPLQGIEVQRATQRERNRKMMKRIAGLQLFDEPQAFLREG